MASLYSVQYSEDSVTGAMYVGNGVIAGFDVYGARYQGSYQDMGSDRHARKPGTKPSIKHVKPAGTRHRNCKHLTYPLHMRRI